MLTEIGSYFPLIFYFSLVAVTAFGLTKFASTWSGLRIAIVCAAPGPAIYFLVLMLGGWMIGEMEHLEKDPMTRLSLSVMINSLSAFAIGLTIAFAVIWITRTARSR